MRNGLPSDERLYKVLSFVTVGFSTGTITGFFQSANLKRIIFSLSISRFQKGSFPTPIKSIPPFCFCFHDGLSVASSRLISAYCNESVKRLSFLKKNFIGALPGLYIHILPSFLSHIPSVFFGTADFPHASSSSLY